MIETQMHTTPKPDLSERRLSQLQDAAQRLETAFLSEMLKGAGVGARKGAFGGGAGEDQFASMLRDQQARQMTESGGIGLAQHLFEALARREGGRV